MKITAIHPTQKQILSAKLHKVFMYGSNLCPNRLHSRIRNWDGYYQLASLPKHELCFNMSDEQLRVGANIMPHPTRKVQGIIIGLDENELKEMDKYEGYPYVYNRVELEVETVYNHKTNVFAYIAQKKWLKDPLLPTSDYLSYILKGASIYKFPKNYIDAIEKLGTS